MDNDPQEEGSLQPEVDAQSLSPERAPQTAKPNRVGAHFDEPTPGLTRQSKSNRSRRSARGGAWQPALIIGLALGSLLTGGLLATDPGYGELTPIPVIQGEVWKDQIVVDLVDGTSDEDIESLRQEIGIDLKYNSKHSQAFGIMIATVPPSVRGAILKALQASPLVEAAEPNWINQALEAPNDPEYTKQWHLHTIGIEDAWEVTKGKGAIVAVIDTGVASENTSQGIRIRDFKQTRFTPGYDFLDDDDIAQELGGHGSHVASTIAESTDNGVLGAGVAPEATIMPMRVLSKLGGSNSDIADAIRLAADRGAHVINMSLGGSPYSKILHLAVQYAHDQDVAVICAAGNSGKEGVEYPARYPEAIAVSATGPRGELAPYSTWGAELDIAGPGGDLSQPNGGVFQNTFMAGEDQWVGLQGTSMASPHVAGVAALLVSQGIRDPEEIRRRLKESALPKGDPLRYGAGKLDATSAIRNAAWAQSFARARLMLAGALGALLLALGSERKSFKQRDQARLLLGLALAGGLALPDATQWCFGFGSCGHFLSHSIVLPAAAFFGLWHKGYENLGKAVLLGGAMHLAMDAFSGDSPFAAASWKRSAWLWIQVGIGALILTRASQWPLPWQMKGTNRKPQPSRSRKVSPA